MIGIVARVVFVLDYIFILSPHLTTCAIKDDVNVISHSMTAKKCFGQPFSISSRYGLNSLFKITFLLAETKHLDCTKILVHSFAILTCAQHSSHFTATTHFKEVPVISALKETNSVLQHSDDASPIDKSLTLRIMCLLYKLVCGSYKKAMLVLDKKKITF